MFSSLRFWLVVFALVAIAGAYWSRSPYGTALPLDVAEIPSIQPQLDKLPAADRQLVLDYLKRSNGDVMPAAFADPDEPFTARTFREAIALQKDFLVLKSKWDAEAATRIQDRDARLAPLRQVLAVQMVNRQLMTEDELYRPAGTNYGAAAAGQSAQPASSGNRFLVVTYRLRNTSSRPISVSKGTVSVRDSADAERAHCFIDHNEPLAAGASAEVRCGQRNLAAGAADIAFASQPASAFTLRWEPSSVVFADGTRMTSGL